MLDIKQSRVDAHSVSGPSTICLVTLYGYSFGLNECGHNTLPRPSGSEFWVLSSPRQFQQCEKLLSWGHKIHSYAPLCARIFFVINKTPSVEIDVRGRTFHAQQPTQSRIGRTASGPGGGCGVWSSHLASATTLLSSVWRKLPSMPARHSMSPEIFSGSRHRGRQHAGMFSWTLETMWTSRLLVLPRCPPTPPPNSGRIQFNHASAGGGLLSHLRGFGKAGKAETGKTADGAAQLASTSLLRTEW